MKIYTNGKVWQSNVNLKKGWFEFELTDQQKVDLLTSKIDVNHDKTTKDKLVFYTEEEMAEFRSNKSKAKESKKNLDEFGKALMDFFLSIMFTLDSNQKITLMSIKEYYKEKGEFPPLMLLAESEPELWSKVQSAIKDGTLPPLPAELAKQL